MDPSMYSFSDDEKMEKAMNDSFDLSSYQYNTKQNFKLQISPIATPKHTDIPILKTSFCPVCIDYYPEHEMYMFKNCSHGLCKLYCADKLISPNCPVCGISLTDDTTEENSIEL